MTWIRLDDGFISHPKTLSLPHKSIVLHIAGLTYCAAQLTDGDIPKSAMPLVLAQARVTKAAVEALLIVQMWRDQGDHYEIHDYLEYQESRETVLGRREKWAQIKRERRAKSTGESTADSNGESTGESAHPDPTRPDPSPLTGSSPSNEDPSSPTSLRGGDGELGEIVRNLFPRIDEAAG